MNWITGIQKGIDYIEDHIEEKISHQEVAREAACSSFYFQRIFSVLCGIPLGEYIRCRRLTLAGDELTSTEDKIIDIALKYGYESPESFTRAFLKFHGITPSEVRKDGSKLRLFSRLSIQIAMKGGCIMNYQIMDKAAFRVLEKVELHKIGDAKDENTIPDFWRRARRDGTIQTLLKNASDGSFLYGICYGNAPTDSKTIEYAIAVPCQEGCKAPEGYRIHTVPARTWAIFECVGAMPESILKMWHRIYAEFFPTSGYQPTCEMDIEAYTEGDPSSRDYKSEIWVSVKK